MRDYHTFVNQFHSFASFGIRTSVLVEMSASAPISDRKKSCEAPGNDPRIMFFRPRSNKTLFYCHIILQLCDLCCLSRCRFFSVCHADRMVVLSAPAMLILAELVQPERLACYDTVIYLTHVVLILAQKVLQTVCIASMGHCRDCLILLKKGDVALG